MNRRPLFVACVLSSLLVAGVVACGDDSTFGGPTPTNSALDSGASTPTAPTPPGTGTTPPNNPTDSGADAGKIIPDSVFDPIPYTSIDQNPFNGVVFKSYRHFEDFESGVFPDAGITSNGVMGAPVSLIDSVDSDDGIVDGKCTKDGGNCNSGFSGSGEIDFTFDDALPGGLPTHVGIAWTDGAPGCDAIFEAYDASMTLIGTKTAAGVGNGNFTGGTDEDRYFGVVHGAGVKKIVVKSSSGGVEVDHLLYGR